MAAIIAKRLQGIGDVCVFELSERIANSHNITRSDDLEKFVIWSDFIVVGGGNLLPTAETWPSAELFHSKIQGSHDLLTCTEKPLYICAASGNEQCDAVTLLPEVRGRIQGHSPAKKRVILGLQRLDLEKMGFYSSYTQ